VWGFGLGNVGATVCSRWLFNASTIITNADPTWQLGYYALWFLPNTADSPYLVGTGSGQPHTNFPYGVPVEPNVPV